MNHKECPYYEAPRYCINPATDEGEEGSAMCKLENEPCLVECGQECEEFAMWLEQKRLEE